ncbi:MAG: heme-copper oxidase subunit III [Nitrospinota bacterium]|nr:heme-copper oxidase subunit III [Nitrospinota bacterium]
MNSEITTEHHWEWSWSPAAIVFGIFFVLPLAFTANFQYENLLLTAIFCGIGVPLLLAGIAKWTSEGLRQKHMQFGYSVSGIAIFIVSEAFIFLSMFASYWLARLSAYSWPPEGTPHISLLLPVVMTIVLVTSSFTIHLAEGKLHEGDMAGFKSNLGITILLGLTFFSMSIYEYYHLVQIGFGMSTNIYSTAFYSITGFHASHVLIGVFSFIVVLIPALGGTVNRTFVQCTAIYWHFVDIIWFFVVTQVYFW